MREPDLEPLPFSRILCLPSSLSLAVWTQANGGVSEKVKISRSHSYTTAFGVELSGERWGKPSSPGAQARKQRGTQLSRGLLPSGQKRRANNLSSEGVYQRGRESRKNKAPPAKTRRLRDNCGFNLERSRRVIRLTPTAAAPATFLTSAQRRKHAMQPPATFHLASRTPL